MTTFTIASGYDANVSSLSPTLNGGATNTVLVGSTAGFPAYLYFPLPPDITGQVITSATLTGTAAAAYSASTVTAKLPTTPWAESTVTFNRQPTVPGSPSQATAVSAGPAGPVSISVGTLVQAVASGQSYYGFQLTASSAIVFNSFESGLTAWSLTIVTQDKPDIPQSLVPNGTIVGSGAPTLTCDFVDNGGLSNDMASMNVQLSTTSSFTSPVYDQTGSTTVPVFNLASPPPGASAFTAVSSGTTRFWRVRVQDADGNWSDWSDPASFTFRTQPTITVLTPAAGVLWDPTSDIIASTSTNLSAYRVQVIDATDTTAIRYDSGRLPANPSALTTVAVSLPQKYEGQRVLVDDQNYQLHIRVWDTFADRQATPGSPAYVDSWSTFHFDDDLTQTPIASLTADQLDASPAVTLTWTRAAAPDAWVVLRDSKVVARLDPADVITGPSTYSWTDTFPQPWVEHDYDVRPLTNVSGTFKRAPAGPIAAIIPECLGVWVFTQDGQQVCLDDTDVSQITVNDRRATYKPINLRYDVDIVTGFEGISGPVAGTIPTGLDDTVELSDAMDVLFSIRRNPAKTVRLVYGSFSGEVLLRNISVTPDARGNVGTPLARVTFSVNQVGDFDQVL